MFTCDARPDEQTRQQNDSAEITLEAHDRNAADDAEINVRMQSNSAYATDEFILQNHGTTTNFFTVTDGPGEYVFTFDFVSPTTGAKCKDTIVLIVTP